MVSKMTAKIYSCRPSVYVSLFKGNHQHDEQMINKMDLPVRSTLDLFFTGLVAPFSLQIFISLERLMKESQLGDAKELFRIEGGFAFPTLDILIRL